MIDEIHRGLNKNTNKTANIKSFVTYVTQLPTGEESGKYLALDLGGTNFRVIVVEITSGCRSIRMQSTKHAVRYEVVIFVVLVYWSIAKGFSGGYVRSFKSFVL